MDGHSFPTPKELLIYKADKNTQEGLHKWEAVNIVACSISQGLFFLQHLSYAWLHPDLNPKINNLYFLLLI